jgi:hypothetical protein
LSGASLSSKPKIHFICIPSLLGLSCVCNVFFVIVEGTKMRIRGLNRTNDSNNTVNESKGSIQQPSKFLFCLKTFIFVLLVECAFVYIYLETLFFLR